MTDNIRYFEHEVASFRHGKFKMLRLKYGFEGEGRFWALNCMIGESERCWLDISKSYNLMNTAAELGLTIDQFHEFPELSGWRMSSGNKRGRPDHHRPGSGNIRQNNGGQG